MGSFYERQDTANNISNGNVINADDLDAEFNALEDAFNGSTGHSHDGTTGEGGPITVVGPAQDVVVTTNLVRPKTDNVIDLGSSSFEWKDLWVDGTANIDSLVADTADINGGTADAIVIGGTTPAAGTFTSLVATSLDGAIIGASTPAAGTFTSLAATSGTVGGVSIATISGTQTLTNKTINLANNTLTATSAQIAAAITDETGTGALVFAGSPALTGTPTAPTAAAGTNTTQVATTAHVFAERTNAATLTNKTLTSPTINSGTISGGTINNASVGATTRSSGAFTTLDANGNVTLGDGAGDTVVVNGTASFPNGDVAIGGSAAASAELTVTSTDKGFLGPRLTIAQRDAIVSPASGLLIYNSDLNVYQVYNGSVWTNAGGGGQFKGNNGTVGIAPGDIFRVNSKTLTIDTTISGTENASCTGPITVDTGVTLTVSSGGTLAVI